MTALSDCLGPPGSDRWGWVLDHGDLRRLQLLIDDDDDEGLSSGCVPAASRTTFGAARNVYSPHLEAGRCAFGQKRRAVQLGCTRLHRLVRRTAAIEAHNSPVSSRTRGRQARGSKNGVFEDSPGSSTATGGAYLPSPSVLREWVSGFRGVSWGRFLSITFRGPHL